MFAMARAHVAMASSPTTPECMIELRICTPPASVMRWRTTLSEERTSRASAQNFWTMLSEMVARLKTHFRTDVVTVSALRQPQPPSDADQDVRVGTESGVLMSVAYLGTLKYGRRLTSPCTATRRVKLLCACRRALKPVTAPSWMSHSSAPSWEESWHSAIPQSCRTENQ
jgi:hypothetical protein